MSHLHITLMTLQNYIHEPCAAQLKDPQSICYSCPIKWWILLWIQQYPILDHLPEQIRTATFSNVT